MPDFKPFSYDIDKNYDYVLDETGNRFTALRKIRWGNRTEYTLDIRKYYATPDGERMDKGCTLTDAAANELVRVLIDTGYGDAEEISRAIENRPDIAAAVSVKLEDNEDFANEVESLKEQYRPVEMYNLGDVV